MPVFQASQLAVVPKSMEVDDNYIDNVVDIAMVGVLDDIGTLAKQQRVAVVLPLMGRSTRPYVDIDGPLSQDLLSFLTNAKTEDMNALRNANDALRLRVSALSKQYY